MQIHLELTQHRPSRLVVGLAASLLAHALLLLAYRLDWQAGKETAVPQAVTAAQLVWVRPAPPPPPVPVSPPRRDRANLARRDVDTVPDRAPSGPVAIEPPATPDPFHVQPAATPAPFDVEAARAAARRLASSADPARADLPVGQFDQERMRVKPQPSTIARGIARAHRRDCKDGIPGGLLAPLLLLMDKKDHGCKW